MAMSAAARPLILNLCRTDLMVVEKRNFFGQNRAGTRGRRISVINISRTQRGMRYSVFGAASADLWSRRRRRRVIDNTRKRRIYSLSGGASRRMALRADETDASKPARTDETDASNPARADETERRLSSGGDDRAQGVLMEC